MERGEGAQVWSQEFGVHIPTMQQFSGGVGVGSCGTSLVNSCPASSADLSEANPVFKASSRAWQAKGSSVPTPPPIPAGNLVTQEVSSGPHGPPGLP